MLSIFNTVLTNQFSVGIYLACLLCAAFCSLWSSCPSL